MDLALGLKPHTGWAIAVLAGGDPARPVVVHRERVVLCPEHLPRAPYHHAHFEELDLDEAAPIVAEVEAAVMETAAVALDSLVGAADGHGRLRAVGLVGHPNDVPPLEQVMASHMLLHVAEGELYRSALDEAARARRIAVAMVSPKRPIADAAFELGTSEVHLEHTLKGLRSDLGPPWQADPRAATAAALAALHAGP